MSTLAAVLVATAVRAPRGLITTASFWAGAVVGAAGALMALAMLAAVIWGVAITARRRHGDPVVVDDHILRPSPERVAWYESMARAPAGMEAATPFVAHAAATIEEIARRRSASLR